MNDIGYIKISYEGLYLHTTDKRLNLEQLEYRRGYVLGAIDYHKLSL